MKLNQPLSAASPSVAGHISSPWVLGLTASVVFAGAFVFGLLPRLQKARAVELVTSEISVPSVRVVTPAAAKPGPAPLLPAEIRAWTEASIVARATGYVKRWHAELGALVKSGDLLAELETPELDRELAVARAQAVQASAASALADTTAARWAALRREALVSQQETDEKLADARLKAAAVESANANVQRLEQLVGFARIVAPFDGVITARRLDVGQLVGPNSTVELYRVAQVETLRIFVRVPQSMASAMAPGLTTEVFPDGRTLQPLAAKLVRTSGAIDATSRTLLVELELPNPGRRILPGSFAQARFTDLVVSAPLAVPANTLLFRSEGAMVAKVDAGNHVKLTPVVQGRDFGALVEILSGVTGSDRIVINPPDSIVDQMEVRLVPDAAPRKP